MRRLTVINVVTTDVGLAYQRVLLLTVTLQLLFRPFLQIQFWPSP